MRYPILSAPLCALVLFAFVGCDMGTPSDSLASATNATSATASTADARRGVVHRVTVGGNDQCEAQGEPNGCNANFSAHAMEMADGTVKGIHTDVVKRDNGNVVNIQGTVDCLAVDGNRAVWGGEVTKGDNLAGDDLAGTRFLSAAIDGGKDGDDLIGYTWVPSGDVRTCENPGFDIFGEGRVFVLNKGQVKIQ